MKRALFCLLLMLQTTTCHAIEPLASSREAFAQALAAVYGIDIEKIVVQPQHPGLPDNPFDPLATPPFFALRADWPEVDPGPRGFATADGCVVTARFPDAIRHLLEAAGVQQSPVPTDAIVRRLMWLYQPGTGNRLIDWHPQHTQVTTSVVAQDANGTIRATWFVERGGHTGLVSVYRADFVLAPDNPPRFTESLLQ